MGQSGLTKGRGIFIGGILVVVALIGYVALDGYPPKDGDSAGAIGVADRYRAEQITDDDVQLNDAEIQYWLQNDDVQKLLRDESFQKAVKDGNYAGIMENEIAQDIFLDAEWASWMIDADFARSLKKLNYIDMRPEARLKAIRERAEALAMQGPDPRMPDFATDAEFIRLFEVAAIGNIVLDADFLKEAVKLVEEYGDSRMLDRRPRVAWSALEDMARDAEIAARFPRVAEIVLDDEWAGLFVEYEYLMKAFLDLDYARQLEKVAMLARDRVDADMLMRRPKISYAGWLSAAELSIASRAYPDWAVDAEFIGLFEDKAAAEIILDVEFLKEALDPELRERIAEVDFLNLRPELSLTALRERLTADLAARVPRVAEIVLDNDFQRRFQLKYIREIFGNAEYASRIAKAVAWAGRARPEAAFIDRRPMLNMKNMRPEAMLAAILPRLELNQASPWSLKDMVSDQEFQRFFVENELAQLLVLDVNYLSIVAEVDAGYLIQRDRMESVVVDAELMSRVIDAEMLNRRPRID